MEQFHREPDTFALSSCPDLPRVSASATRGGKLACSSFRPKRVHDSASPPRDPHDIKAWKLFLSTLSASEWPSLRLICDSESFWDLGSPTVSRAEDRVKKSCPHVVLHMGSCLGGAGPKEETLDPSEDGGEARLLWLQGHQLVPWTDYEQHAYLCTYSSSCCLALSRQANIMHHPRGRWRPCFLIHLHSINCLNQACLFIILPNRLIFIYNYFFKVRNSESTEERALTLS